VASLDVIALDTATPQLRAPAVGDTYHFCRVAEFQDGTAAAPGITNVSDTNTGIYFPADNTLGISANGVESFRAGAASVIVNNDAVDIDFQVKGDTDVNLIYADASTDRLGVGTATPAFKLDVNGTVKGSAIYLTDMTAGAGALYYNVAQNRLTLANYNASGTIVFESNGGLAAGIINANGDWGIGTTTPAYKLDVNGTANFAGGVTYSGGTANGVLYLNGSKVATSGSALVFDGTNLGIGTSSPAAKLHVSGQTRIADSSSASNYILIGSGANAPRGGNSVMAQTGSMVMGTEAASNLIFITNAAEAGRFDSSGNLGIGTSSPDRKLFVYTVDATGKMALFQNGNTNTNLYLSSDPTSGGGVINVSNNAASAALPLLIQGNGTTRVTLDSSGNLGLGVTPSAWVGGRWMQFLSTSSVGQQGNGTANLMCNAFESSSNSFSYIASAGASRYNVQAGTHAWFIAPSGTAGNAISFTQALTLDANRNLLLNGTAAPASGVGTFAIFNGTAPTGSVTDGCVLYTEDVSSSSELKVRDEAGNVTTLSPHNFSLISEGPSEDMAWSYYSERDGKRINIDMLKAIRVLEKLSGEKLVHES
jgi:hypothetical protein